MTKKNIGLTALALGLLALLSYLLHDIIGGLLYPGYRWTEQAVSDITSLASPSRTIAGIFTKLYGLSAILCCILTRILSKKEAKVLKVGISLFLAMNLVSAFGYTLFPLTEAGAPSGFQNVMHIVVTVFVVLLSIASLIVLAIGGFRNGRNRLGISAAVALLLMMAGAIGSNVAPKTIFGIVERFSTYSAAAFTLVVGIFGHEAAKEI